MLKLVEIVIVLTLTGASGVWSFSSAHFPKGITECKDVKQELDIHEFYVHPDPCGDHYCTIDSQQTLNISIKFKSNVSGTKLLQYLYRIIDVGGLGLTAGISETIEFYKEDLCNPKYGVKCPYEAKKEQHYKFEGKPPAVMLAKGEHTVVIKVKGDGDKVLSCHTGKFKYV